MTQTGDGNGPEAADDGELRGASEGANQEQHDRPDKARDVWRDPMRGDPSFEDPDEVGRERVRRQVQVVIEALGDQPISWADDSGNSDDMADFKYLYHSREVLVRDAYLPAFLDAYGGEVVDGLVTGLTLVRLPEGLDVPATLEDMDGRLGVGAVTPNHVLYVVGVGGCCPATEPEVPYLLDPVPPVSQDPTYDGSGVLVSVVDTGWHPPAAAHARSPWLQGVTGDAELFNANRITHYVGHGTFVAGVVRCMAPKSTVSVEGFLRRGGAVLESEVVKELAESLHGTPDVISLSAGCYTRLNLPLLSFQVLWETRLSQLKGTVLVAAAGNDATRDPFWPAAFPWAVSVGALTPDGRRAPFSNFGSWVDVYAPGVDLVNAYPEGTFICSDPPNAGLPRRFAGVARWSGTSFATPVVSGLIAARMSGKGETAGQAARALLKRARARARPGVGACLEPGPRNFR